MADEALRRDIGYERGATALLLVDMQRIWVEPGGAHDDYHRHLAGTVVPNQQRLLESARRAGVEVLHTLIRSLTRDGRDRSLDHKLSAIHVAPDDPAGDIIDPLAPRGDEIMLPKTSSGVFNSTNIDFVLRNLGVKFLVVAGIVTDQCVDMAVRDAADRGYYVTCVHDACATYTAARHEAALRAFGGYCWTTDTATVAARFAALAP